MNELHFPLLELTILTPALGALVVRRRNPDQSRRLAIAFSFLALLFALMTWFDLADIRVFEAHDKWTVLGWLPGGDPFIVDELSAPLLPLAALQFFLTIVATLRTKAARFSFALTLVSESLVLATFATRNTILLAALLVAATVPPAIELIRRGQPTRVFVQHMGLFAALLFVGVLAREVSPANSFVANGGTFAIAIAILIRSGVVPFHLWVRDLFERASFGTAILFVTPMTGAYGALRFLLPTSSDAVLRLVAVMSLLTVCYAAAMALVQRDARRFYAYVFLSHASLVLLGLELNSLVGLTGALCVWLSVGLAMLGFGLTLRCVESRTGRISLDRYHGMHDASPALSGMFLLTGLASIGFPGTIGFIAVEMLIDAAVHTVPLVGVLVVIATALNGLAVMQAYFRIFTGREHLGTIDLRIRPAERFAVLVLSLLILGGGVIPQPGVSSRRHAAEAMLQRRNQIEPHAVIVLPTQLNVPSP